MALALRSTLSPSTIGPQQFQLFHPSGGVSAMVSPTTILNCFELVPFEFRARKVTLCSPGLLNEPVMRPVFASSARPEGR